MKEPSKHLFEGTYILSAALSESARQKAFQRIVSGIESRGGEVHKTFDQGRKKLGTSIQRKKEGYFYLLFFSVPAPAIAEMRQEYRLHEDLLRFMLLRVESVPEKIEFKPLVQQ